MTSLLEITRDIHDNLSKLQELLDKLEMLLKDILPIALEKMP